MKEARSYGILTVIFVLIISLSSSFCDKKKDIALQPKKKTKSYEVSFDSTLVSTFYAKYPKLILYKKQVVSLYQKNNYNFIWYDKKGRKEIADVIYNKINNLYQEGIQAKLPYKETLDGLLPKTAVKPDVDTELFLSNYYFFYVNKAVQGIDSTKIKELEWYLPRKKQSYVGYLDSLLVDPKLIDKPEQQIPQYYKLKAVLQKYRDIEQKGGWDSIKVPTDFVQIKPGDSSEVVAKIRKRLFLTGDIAEDSGRQLYGYALQQAVLKFKKRMGLTQDKTILPKHIDEMNVPVSERIKTIIVNMERCRWIPTDIGKAKEFIFVNIPSYKLRYFRDGKEILNCNVVVGSTMNKTVIFSGMMSSIVFSPYWNVTPTIIKTEILPEMKKDKNYLTKHNMEWNNGAVRQKPGKSNSLGLVKFLFPNNNNIYLHDTPAKSLFSSEKRAFSHGCIRVEKPKELANLILENDPNWTPEKIDKAMHKNKENWYVLKEKIPVYIGYFTALVDEDGNINFYKDVYGKDPQLASMLVEE
ncbi:MAG TPA: L,D-transpeptidase family protein [Flavobacterium sp.]|uniref:L,D-transpeptidase family protein n=1 Tax=Flavobacterium sp. TaxID=239 RepID=UPI002B878984|nr:L,D-transpeptidase family protein [Flavobacterium sp.]HNP33464.1 L,D-transpeptidase family protein [Flavobacterium sp.]